MSAPLNPVTTWAVCVVIIGALLLVPAAAAWGWLR